MKNPLIYCAAAALASVLITQAAANDWPQWRGPNRENVTTETNLLADLPAGGPPLAWKASGLGNGYSTVAVANGRIFTMGDRGEESFAIGLNAADGRQIWSAKVGKGGAVGWGGFEGPRSTPTVDGDLVFAVGQWGDLVCLDAASGKERWRKNYDTDFHAPLPEWGYAESPVVDGGNVIVTPGGSEGAVVALNEKTGAVVWRSREFKDPAHYASLIVAEIGGVRQYIGLTADSVAGIAAADGKLLWRATRKGSTAVIPTPIYHDGFLYVSSGYGTGCNAFKITEAGGEFTATQVYANKVMANHLGGVVRIGENIYGHSDGKGWTCQDLKTGKDAWQEKEKMGKGSVTGAGNRLYLRTEEGKGTVALIEASPQGYKEHGRFDPPGRSGKNSWPPPVIANGKLYLRDQDTLLCYDIAKH